MAKQENLEFTGEVIEELGNSMFRVEITNINTDAPPLVCTISGKIRKNYIKIMVGDKVKIDVSPYDLTKGRIKQRLPMFEKAVTENEEIINKKSNKNKKKQK